MKGAKVRVEPKTIHTADVDAFATLPQRQWRSSGGTGGSTPGGTFMGAALWAVL